MVPSVPVVHEMEQIGRFSRLDWTLTTHFISWALGPFCLLIQHLLMPNGPFQLPPPNTQFSPCTEMCPISTTWVDITVIKVMVSLLSLACQRCCFRLCRGRMKFPATFRQMQVSCSNRNIFQTSLGREMLDHLPPRRHPTPAAVPGCMFFSNRL